MDTKFEIISDSSLDLPEALVEARRIHVVPYQISFDGVRYEKEVREIPIRKVYERMVAEKGVFPKTSMPSVMDYYEMMAGIAGQGKDMVCICMTSLFTSSIQSALNAADMVAKDYPGVRISVIDSTLATALQGLYVLEAVSLREAGVDIDAAVKRLEEIKSTGIIFFAIDSMDYLIHGGRVGKMTGMVAGRLRIKPLVSMRAGELFSLGVARTREQSKEKILKMFCCHLEEQGIALSDCRAGTGFGYDMEEGARFHERAKSLLRDTYGYDDGEFLSYQIGATIAVHTGPYPIGIGMIEKAMRRDGGTIL